MLHFIRVIFNSKLSVLDVADVNELVKVGAEIREWVINTPLPEALEKAVRAAYAQMMSEAVEAERELKGVSTLSLHVTDFHSSAMPYAFDIIIGEITEDLKSGPGCSCIKF